MIGMRDCPFCRNDPYHYEDNGCGMEAVAVWIFGQVIHQERNHGLRGYLKK